MDNMKGFGMMIQELKKNPKTIVFTEGTDERILEAASRLLAGSFLTPILVGNKEAVLEAAEKYGYNIRGGEIIDPDDYERFDEMVELFCELRKSKGVTPEQAAKTLKKNNYFGTMLVKMGVADALLGGATYSTADTVRPALQLIKTKPGSSCVSSCFILFVRQLQVRTKFLLWVTARLISNQQRISLQKSHGKLQNVVNTLVSIQRLHS